MRPIHLAASVCAVALALVCAPTAPAAPERAADPVEPPGDAGTRSAPVQPLDLGGFAADSCDRSLAARLSPAGVLALELRAAGSLRAWQARRGALVSPGARLPEGVMRPEPLCRRPVSGTDAAVSRPDLFEARNPAYSYQSESSIAAWRGGLLVGFNDSRGYADLDQGIAGWSYSADGGATWVDGGGLPRFGRNLFYLGDPVVAHDGRGNFYYACIALDYGSSYNNPFPLSILAVARGRFQCDAFVWDTVFTAASDADAFLDKGWLTVDPRTGWLYLAYVRFSEETPYGQIELVRSHDRGLQWAGPVVVGEGGPSIQQGPRPAVGPRGEVYVVWERGLYEPAVDELRLRRSDDGGRSFGPPVQAAKLGGEWRFPPAGYNRAYQHFPVIAVDRSRGAGRGDVYLAWNEAAELEEEPGNGTVYTELPNDEPALAQPVAIGDDVVADFQPEYDQDWYRVRLEQGRPVVIHARSDGFVNPVAYLVCVPGLFPVVANDNDYGDFSAVLKFVPPLTGDYLIAVVPRQAVLTTGGYVLQVRAAHVPAASVARDMGDILVARSSDGGLTWSAPRRANDGPPWTVEAFPALAVNELGWVLAGWHDERESASCSTPKAYYAALARHGTRFGPDFAVSDVATSWFGFGLFIPNFGDYTDVTADGARFHAAWSDARAGSPDIWSSVAAPPFHAERDADEGDSLFAGSESLARAEAVDDAAPPWGLTRAAPNPVRDGATFEFALAEPAPVSLAVYDLGGRRVVTLLRDRVLAAGRHARFWDLRDAGGRRVSAGVYLAHWEAAGHADTRRVTVLP